MQFEKVIHPKTGEPAIWFIPISQTDNIAMRNIIGRSRDIDIEKIFFPLKPTTANLIKSLCVRTETPFPNELLREFEAPLVLPADFNPTLPPMEHQKLPIAAVLNWEHCGLFLDMGCGKTFISIQSMIYWQEQQKDCKFLVVCPKGVIPTWEVEIPKFDTRKVLYLLTAGSNHGVEFRSVLIAAGLHMPGVVLVTTYDTFSDKKSNLWKVILDQGIKFNACFWDESTKVRNTDTERYKGAIKLASVCERRYVLCGFPSPQSPADYVGQCALLHPAYLGYTASAQYERENAIRSAGNKITSWARTDLLKKSLQQFCISMSKEDAGLKLPPIRYKTHYVTMEDSQRKCYENLALEYIASVNALPPDALKSCGKCGGAGIFEPREETAMFSDSSVNPLESSPAAISRELSKRFSQLGVIFKVANKCNNCNGSGMVADSMNHVVMANGVLSKLLRLRQVTGGFTKDTEGNTVTFPDNPKMEALREIINGDYDTPGCTKDGPFVVFAVFRNELQAISREFDIPIIYGGNKDGEVAEIIRGLQSGKYRGVVIQAEAGGYGLNLQMCKTMVYFSNDFKLDPRVQSEARLHRIGQNDSVLCVDIMASKSIDGYVKSRLNAKKDVGLEILNFPNAVYGEV